MLKAGLLFPGQGAQYAGMGAEFYSYSETFKKTFDRIGEAAGMDLKAVCFEGKGIDETARTQPAIYAVSVATLALLQELGVEAERCAGLSLGEYPALACAGVFDAADGAALVRRRGELMGAFDGTGGLAAVAGLTFGQIAGLLERDFAGRNLFISNYNLPEQLVVGGEAGLLEPFCALALETGAKIAKPLRTSGPFHTPMMGKAGDGLREYLSGRAFNDPRCEVYSNVLGAPYPGASAVGELLARQVSERVQWLDCLRGMAASDLLVEVGPGTALSGMVRRLDRAKPSLSVQRPEDLGAVTEWLNGRKVL